MSKEFNAKMKLLVKSEKSLLNIEIKKRARQSVWIALALLAILSSLILLNITIFLYLSQSFTNLESSIILLVLNVLFAILCFVIALKENSSPQEESIKEIRDFAWEQVSDDIDQIKQHVTDLKENVSGIKSKMQSFTSASPLGKIVPIVSTLIDLNKKR